MMIFNIVIYLIIFANIVIVNGDLNARYTGISGNISYDISINDNKTQIILRIPDSNWVGIGFGTLQMNGSYVIIWSLSFSEGIREYILGHHNQGRQLINDCMNKISCFELISSSIDNGIHTITMERNNTSGSVYRFSPNMKSEYIILARGDSPIFNGTKHKEKSSQYIQFENNQYINISKHPQGLIGGDVTCNNGINCYISCIGEDICHFKTIYAANASNLYLECIGVESCGRADIYGPIDGNMVINCNKNTTIGNGACVYVEIFANDVNNVSINCEMENDCYSIDIEINRAINVDINFNGEHSGYGAWIGAENVSESFNLRCNGNESCMQSTIYCPSTEHGAKCIVECNGASSGCKEMKYYIDTALSMDVTSITCPDGSNCYISCIGEDRCRMMRFHGEKTVSMYLDCVGRAACGQSDIFGPSNDGDLTIDCDSNINGNMYYPENATFGEGACEYMNIDGNNINRFKINCYFDFDCVGIIFDIIAAKYVTIHYDGKRSGYGSVINAYNLTGYLEVICNGTQSCQGTDLVCPEIGSFCNVDCIGESSCAKMRYYIPSRNYDKLHITCSQFEKTHCFWINNTLIPLSYNAEIYCDDTDEKSELIYNIWSDKLSCHDNCCPFEVEEIEECIKIDDCIINCTSIFCDGRIINGMHKNSLTVICKENNVNSTCNGLQIICPVNGNCLIECDIYSGCKALNITHNAAENVENISNITLLCNNTLTCRDIVILAPNANSVEINASEYKSLYAAGIHVNNVNIFKLFCYNKDDAHFSLSSCSNDRLYISGNNKIDIYCKGSTCSNIYFYIDNGNGWNIDNNNNNKNMMNVNIESNCQCSNGDWKSCINSIAIYCGYSVIGPIHYTYFNQMIQGNCSNVCGCNNLIKNINNNYIDDDINDCNINNIDTTTINQIFTTMTKTNNKNKSKSGGIGSGAITGIIMAILMIIGAILILWYFCIYKKQQNQIRAIHVRQTSHIGNDDEFNQDDIIMDKETNNDDILLTDGHAPTKR